MLNFTVGPVMSGDAVCAIGAEQVPYFRTPEFSAIMLENERLIKKFAGADENARVCFLTGSGTASMEAAVINIFTPEDRVLVIDPGSFSFGHRFAEMLEIHGIPHTVIKPDFACGVTEKQLAEYDGKGYTGFLVNLDETSVGVLYDIRLISDFCRRNGLFLVVDSISSFLCDPFDMKELNVQVMITGSQKALACPPGVSLIVLSPDAVERVYSNNPQTMYLDLKLALKNGERGQTPFTCAVGILRQINQRLKEIDAAVSVDDIVSEKIERRKVVVMRVLIMFFIAISLLIALNPPTFIAQLMGISWGALAGAFLAPFMLGLYSRSVTTASVWACFIWGVGLTVVNMLMGNPINPINCGAIAMVGGFPVVWIVSLFTKKLPKSTVDTIFECYK